MEQLYSFYFVLGINIEILEYSEYHSAPNSYFGVVCADFHIKAIVDGEIVGGDFTGLAQNLPKTGQHGAAVRHKQGSYQETNGEEAEEQLQESALGEVFDLIHKAPRIRKL